MAKTRSAQKAKHVFKNQNYSEIEKEVFSILNEFPNLITTYQRLRDQIKPEQFESRMQTDELKTNLKALERWSKNVINGNRILNYKPTVQVMSECSNAIGFFFDYELFVELSRDIGSSHFLQQLQGIIMSQTGRTNRMLLRLRLLLLHFTPSIADQDQFCSEIHFETISEVDSLLSADLISMFESYNDKSEDNVQLIFKQGGSLEDSRKMMMDHDIEFIRTLANDLDVYIHSMRCFVDYMKKNSNYIQNIRDVIEKRGSTNHQ